MNLYKPKVKEKNNSDYFEYIKGDIILLVERKDGTEDIAKIKNKLDVAGLDIFNNITTWISLSRFAYLNSRRFSFEKEEEYNKKVGLLNLRDESDNNLDKYLNSIKKETFIEAIANITYWLAKFELERMISIQHSFLKSWHEWHIYLNKRDKNKTEGEKIKEKLRVVIGDQIDDYEKIAEQTKKDFERFLDGKEELFVNIDQEIDVNNCTTNEMLELPRYLGEEPHRFRVVECHTKCITKGNRTYSLREYYDEIKVDIDKSWLKSKDLLQNILIIYLIKRCQRGDNYAFEKLFSFYVDTAKHLAIRFISNKAKNYNLDGRFNDGGALSQDSAVSASEQILSLLLKGDNLDNLFKYLNKDRADKKEINFLNKKPYDALNESYETMFIMINGVYEGLKNKLKFLEAKTKDIRHRLKKATGTSRLNYAEKLWKMSHYILSSADLHSAMFLMLNPTDLIKLSPKHNKWLFRPTTKGNLTTWLFGSGDFSGMILNGLNDWFKKQTYTVDGKRHVKEQDFYNSSFDEDNHVEDQDSGIYTYKSTQKD